MRSQSQPGRDAGPIARAATTSEPSAAKSDFHVRNALGTTLFTTDNLDLARNWVRRNLRTFPSLRVERVTLTVTREVVFRPSRPAFVRLVETPKESDQ